jgi:hypothetical protein
MRKLAGALTVVLVVTSLAIAPATALAVGKYRAHVNTDALREAAVQARQVVSPLGCEQSARLHPHLRWGPEATQLHPQKGTPGS